MPPKTIRFPDDLAEKIQARADATDRSFSYVVLRALESALNGDSARTDQGVSRPSPSASTRASRVPGVKTARELAMERQAKLNEAKS